MYALKNADFDQILQFSSEAKKDKDFRQGVLSLLLSMYDFKHSTFLLVDEQNTLKDPVGINISRNLLGNYNKYYYKTDFFANPEKHTKDLLQIPDFMTYSEYESTEYYNDFLKKDDLYYQVAIPLKSSGRLIGGLGIFRGKKEGNFTEKETSILSYISKIVSNNLESIIEKQSLASENSLLYNSLDTMPVGFISLESNLRIKNFNNIATEFCKKIVNAKCNNYDTIKIFLEKLTKKITINQLNSTDALSLTMSGYNIQIRPVFNVGPFNKIELFINIYILEQDMMYHKISRLKAKYKLTNRENDVINLIVKGYANKEISQKLFISNHTVKTHIENIFRKLDINNRGQVIKRIYELN